MGFTIREADLDADADVLVAFLRANLPDHGGHAHYDWLYRRNPFGRARAWIASARDGRAIGAAAAFPRPIEVDGRVLEGWVLGDFAVDAAYRALGPAIRLQRAVLDAVTAHPDTVVYDHPAAAMLAVYRWLKIEPAGTVTRHAKPLRFDTHLARLPLGRALAGPANLATRLADAVLRPRQVLVAQRLEGRFPPSTDGLIRAGSVPGQVRGVRTAEYLNWRYLDSPPAPHEVVAVSDASGAPRGYAVYRCHGRRAVLRDMLGQPETDVIHALLRGVVREARLAGAETLSAPVRTSTPLAQALLRWGFRAREAAPFVVVSRVEGPLGRLVGEARNWHVMDGDRDV